MYKVKLMNKISSVGLDYFNEDYEYGETLENEDAILLRSASLHEYEFTKNVKAIARAGAGVNNIPVEKCSEKGIVVFNTPGANANAVKELVLCALFLSSRKIVESIEWVNTLKDDENVGKTAEKGKSNFVGPEIEGKKLGVIGLGAIGVLVANAANKLGMAVYGYDPFMSVNSAWALSKHVRQAKDMDEIFKTCDYITVHVPSTKDTKGMLNKEKFALMKDGARLLNFARGDLVVNEDLLEAVESGKLSKYITDFASQELIGKDNIDKLKNATVAVFGCGGVGSYAVEALARAGIGNFVLVDKDVVDVTNINRQLVADFSTIGMDKVEVEKERILKVNPDANVEIHKEFYCEENKEKLIRENYTYIVDAIDSVSSKLSLIITAHEKNVKIISAMGMGNKLDPTQIEVSDISKTSVCPLAKTIRKQLRAKGINHSKVVYSRELPNRFDKSEEYRRTTASISFVPSVCGLIIASQIVRDLIDEF